MRGSAPWRRSLAGPLLTRALLAAVTVAALAAAFLLGGGSAWAKSTSDLAFVGASAVAAMSFLARARRTEADRERSAWRWLAVAAGVWCAGAVAWAYLGMTRGHDYPFPSVADIGFTGYVLPAAVGLSRLRARQSARVSRVHASLDAAVIGASTLFVSWSGVLGPLYRGPADGWLARSATHAYLVVDVVLVSLVLALGMRQPRGSRATWVVLGGGFITLAVSDSIYSYQTSQGTFELGHPFDVGRVAAFLLMAIAAAAPAGFGHADDSRLNAVQELVPYVPFAAAVAAAALGDLAGDPFLLGVGLVVGVVALTRQVVVVVEHIWLANNLERLVSARTTALDDQRRFLSAMVSSLEEGVLACDAGGELVLVNDAARRIYPDAVRAHDDAAEARVAASGALVLDRTGLARALRGATIRDHKVTVERGGAHPLELSSNGGPILDASGAVAGAVVALHDVTDRIRLQRDLEHRATHDELTGLGNRARLRSLLAEALDEGRRAKQTIAVALFDLDDFKRVNDSFGHRAGDDLLVTVGERLNRCVREGDVAVRLGGDEFALVLRGASARKARSATERALAAISTPLHINGTEIQVRASVGVVVVPAGQELPDLLQLADLAMYHAKSTGKGRVSIFEPSMAAAAAGRLRVESDLRRALRRGQLSLAYQPVVNLASGQMTGTEALLRWDHPEHGAVSPADFIPVAEESGLILPIGEWVLRTACRQLAAWDATVGVVDPMTMAVNVSIRQLERPGFADVVRAVLDEAGITPSRLVLEITETALGDDDAVHEQLEELDRLGVALSIDDFGTGYSSLARLRSSPVRFVKLDRTFVEEVTDADSPVPMLQAIVAMAAALGVGVVAEGIETVEQFAQLRAMGCQAGQGFMLSRPVDPDTITALLSSGESLAPMAACAQPLILGGAALEAVITDAISNPAVDLDHVIRPILDQLQAITGFDSAYLTRIDWAKLEQHITHAHNAGALAIPEGAIVEWSDTLCRRALEGGTSCISDVAAAHPDCTAAVELGIVSYATATVEPEPGIVYGTLCAASSRPGTLSAGQHAAMQLFARLIAEKLPGGRPGRQGGPSPPDLR